MTIYIINKDSIGHISMYVYACFWEMAASIGSHFDDNNRNIFKRKNLISVQFE